MPGPPFPASGTPGRATDVDGDAGGRPAVVTRRPPCRAASPQRAAHVAPDLFSQLASSDAGNGRTFGTLHDYVTNAESEQGGDDSDGIPTSVDPEDLDTTPPAPPDAATQVDARTYLRHYTYAASND